MKKISFLLGIILLTVMVMSSPVFSAEGTCSQSRSTVDGSIGNIKIVTFTCTANSATGGFPEIVFSTSSVSFIKSYYLYKVITNPGSTAPTDNWDFTIIDDDGIDVLGGAGSNRHTTTSQSIYPLIGTQPFAQPVLGPLTLNITGNIVNLATLVIKTIFVR